MNNFNSLAYFIPELILFGLIFFLFLFHGTKRRVILIVQRFLIFAAALTALLLYSSYWLIRPTGLFYNSFVVDPFASFMSVILIVIFIFQKIVASLKSTMEQYTDLPLFQTISLFAALLLVKSNSLVAVILSIGIIFISNIGILYENKVTKSILHNFTFHFVFITFTFSVLYAFSGSFYLRSGIMNALLVHPFSYAVITSMLVFGFGLYGIIFPFQYILQKDQKLVSANIFLSASLIPLLAFFGLFIRLYYCGLQPPGFIQDLPLFQGIFFIILSIIIITTANALLKIKKDFADLLIISIIIHTGLSLAGLAAFSAESAAASIYLTISTILILIGILTNHYLLDQSTIQWKIQNILYYFGLIGLPGTSGFTGRFLIFRALFHSDIPTWLTILLIISILPMVIYLSSEILRLITKKPEQGISKNNVIASIPAILMIILGIFWEPFYRLIYQSIVFFRL